MAVEMEDTIAAISTPIGVGGIGIVRMSGSKSQEILNRIFRTKSGKQLTGLEDRRFYYGHIVDGQGQVIDEVLVVVMKAPHSYTKEDVVEIHCHGGIIPLRQILKLVIECGARLAQPGEFTKRAFLNGRIDLAQAEGIMELIYSQTEIQARASIKHMEGALSEKIRGIRGKLLNVMAHIEVTIDYPEEDIEELPRENYLQDLDEVMKEIDYLLSTAEQGKIIRHGIKVVIVGKPNVGKSSLLNALLKENRAIVTDIPGTTRDVIEESLNINGLLVRILDTAGIRETTDIVEELGVERSRKSIEEADLVLWVLDASRPFDDEDKRIMAEIADKKVIAVVNKIDKPIVLDLNDIELNVPVIRASMILNKGIEDIERCIYDAVMEGKVESDDGIFITNLRHQEALMRAKEHVVEAMKALEGGIPVDLVSIDIREACDALGAITGEAVTEDLIEKIFSEFCVGK
ncbi:tRNA modification GTPase [Caldicoprobacter guelmensis]|nr:tRNA uridine-5-carboxymethylaminomethyl(34) synthesis GTPase MnmE [Caldicoprobacter guelmensis]MBM7583264.1 tRNA modification GTPase [Caldicoprobacter guelmensis]